MTFEVAAWPKALRQLWELGGKDKLYYKLVAPSLGDKTFQSDSLLGSLLLLMFGGLYSDKKGLLLVVSINSVGPPFII